MGMNLLASAVSMSDVSAGTYQLAVPGYLRPELVVIEVALVGLATGVIDILHIDEDTDFFQNGSL